MKKQQIRQGDLLFKPVGELPIEVTKSSDKILALDESTGHKHKLMATNVSRHNNDTIIQYVEIVEPDTVVHEEHSPVNLDRGNYQVIHQREFDYEAYLNEASRNTQSFRNVMD